MDGAHKGSSWKGVAGTAYIYIGNPALDKELGLLYRQLYIYEERPQHAKHPTWQIPASSLDMGAEVIVDELFIKEVSADYPIFTVRCKNRLYERNL